MSKLRQQKNEFKFSFRITSETENYFWLVAQGNIECTCETKDFVCHEDSQRDKKTTQVWKMRYALREDGCDVCNTWFHVSCTSLRPITFIEMAGVMCSI
jgi:hypothetical protein